MNNIPLYFRLKYFYLPHTKNFKSTYIIKRNKCNDYHTNQLEYHRP